MVLAAAMERVAAVVAEATAEARAWEKAVVEVGLAASAARRRTSRVAGAMVAVVGLEVAARAVGAAKVVKEPTEAMGEKGYGLEQTWRSRQPSERAP
jgi:hypothetical protein